MELGTCNYWGYREEPWLIRCRINEWVTPANVKKIISHQQWFCSLIHVWYTHVENPWLYLRKKISFLKIYKSMIMNLQCFMPASFMKHVNASWKVLKHMWNIAVHALWHVFSNEVYFIYLLSTFIYFGYHYNL